MIEPLPIGLSAVGAFVAYHVSIAQHPVIRYPACIDPTDQTYCTTVHRLYCYFNKRWFSDQLVNDFLVRSCIRFGYEVSFEASDKGAIELLGPTGISYTCRQLAKRISQLQSGFVAMMVRLPVACVHWRSIPRNTSIWVWNRLCEQLYLRLWFLAFTLVSCRGRESM